MAQVFAPRQAKAQVVMKPETIYGTDVIGGTYLTTDIIRAISDSIRVSPNIQEFVNQATSGHLGRLPSAIGVRTGRITWDMFMRGRGVAYAAGTRPEADLPLRGCGLAATVDATATLEKVTYQPSDTHEAMGVYLVYDIPGGNALSFQFVGTHGTITKVFDAGGPTIFRFEYEGVLEEIADIAYVGGTPSPTPALPTAKSCAFQIGSANYAPRISTVEFSMGNLLRRVPSINAPTGLEGFQIRDREPMLLIDPEIDREASSGWWAALQDGDPLLDCTYQLGAAQYNRLKMSFRATGAGTAAGIQVVGMEPIVRDEGLAAVRMRLRPTIGAGNDDFSLVFD